MVASTEDLPADVAPWKRMRYAMVALATVGFTISFCVKSVTPLAIIAMTDKTANADFETFNWDHSTQSTILSSIYWGSAIFMVPAGLLLQKYGLRWVFLGSVLMTGVIYLVIPFIAHPWDWGGVCAMTAVVGVSQSVLTPAVGALISVWATQAEYSLLASICLCAGTLGHIIALPIGGALASNSGGWPSIFYFFGGLCVTWCILWFFLGFDSPDRHPYILEDEKRYIMSNVKKTVAHSLKTPWIAMLTSAPVWVMAATECAHTWGYSIVVTQMPTYMKNILHYNIEENGTLSAMPFVAQIILAFIFGWSSYVFISKNILSVKWARKIYNTIGLAGPMMAMIGLGYVGKEEKDVAVALFIISSGFNAAIYSGSGVNAMELTHNYITSLMALLALLGSGLFSLVPLIIPKIVVEQTSEENWQTLFWITGAIYLAGSLIFLFFASHELQPWDDAKRSESNEVNA